MQKIEKRALYNLLRMNWLNDPRMSVEPWQVEDYREIPVQTLLQRLKSFNVVLDSQSFIAFAEEVDTPEELCDYLIGDRELLAEEEDPVYLLVFELWRRLIDEKPSLSIFCDELDHQIHQYDHGNLKDLVGLTSMIDELIKILDDNVDQGIEAPETFQLISTFCANDIETFLYDFIFEQIENENSSYAEDLLDALVPYLPENKWFKLLRTRLAMHIHPKISQKLVEEIVEEVLPENDLEYNLEFLSVLIEFEEEDVFSEAVQKTIPLLSTEEDFQDLILLCANYLQCGDKEQEELVLRKILEKRTSKDLEAPLSKEDSDIKILAKFF